jgi:hypothetical protein
MREKNKNKCSNCSSTIIYGYGLCIKCYMKLPERREYMRNYHYSKNKIKEKIKRIKNKEKEKEKQRIRLREFRKNKKQIKPNPPVLTKEHIKIMCKIERQQAEEMGYKGLAKFIKDYRTKQYEELKN